MAQLSISKGDFLPSNLIKIVEADNIPEAVLKSGALELFETVFDHWVLSDWVRDNATMTFTLPTGHTVKASVWDLINYFGLNGAKLAIDLPVLIGELIWIAFRSGTKVRIEGGSHIGGSGKRSGTGAGSTGASSEEEMSGW